MAAGGHAPSRVLLEGASRQGTLIPFLLECLSEAEGGLLQVSVIIESL